MHLRIHRSRRLLVAAAFAAAIVASGIAASSASAILKRLPSGQIVSYHPLRSKAPAAKRFDTMFNNMDYNGGPVMPSNTAHLVFWSPKGYGAYPGGGSPPEYVRGLVRYFKDLQHDSGTDHNVNSVDPQYNDLTGAFARYSVRFGGAILDRDPYPASQCPVHHPVTNCLTDAQLQAELEHVAAVHHLASGLNQEMFLFTPPRVAGCFTNKAPNFGGCSVGIIPSKLAAYCAYHGQTLPSPMRFYSDDPFTTGVKIGGQLLCESGHHPNGVSDGAIDGGLSHELNESVTDPIPNDAWTNGVGANHGLEVGDQCDIEMGTPIGTHNGQPYNQVINGHFYWYQEEWSNFTNQCVQRITLPARVPTAALTVKAKSGLAMTFNATGSTAPGGVAAFSWQWNAVKNAPTVETTKPRISHTFPAGGLYSVGLAVFGPNGQSIGTGGIIRPGRSGFRPGFTFLPSRPRAGQPVEFDGRTTISRHPVKTYLWEFGDGSTGSGESPRHTYARPGTYRVKVVQFSGIGSAFPGSGAAPISVERVTVK